MPTRVVNLRCAVYDQYIGRPSMFGNPYAVGPEPCKACGKPHSTAELTLPCYRKWLQKQRQDPDFEQEFQKLKGHVLGCYCKPGPCHGDVIVELLDGA